MEKIITFIISLIAFCSLEANQSAKNILKEVFPAVKVSAYIPSTKSSIEIPAEFEKIDATTYRIRIPNEIISPEWGTLNIYTPLTEASLGEKGYWFGADGRLGYFTEENASMFMRFNPMPIFGLKKSNIGVLVQVRGMRHDFMTICIAQNGKYRIFPSFLLREAVEAYEDIVVDYKIFKNSDANYSAMARSYRKEQLKSGKVIPLKERAKNNPVLAYAAESIFVKIPMGSRANPKKQKHNDNPKINVWRTYDDVLNILEKLKEVGVDKAEICLTGWQTGGHDGNFPTLFPAEPAMGGDAGLAKVIAKSKELGFRISGHVCHDDAYSVSPDFDIADIAKSKNGAPKIGGITSGGLMYKLCYKQYFNKFLDKEIKGMKQRGFNGSYHVDVTTAVSPRSCFDPKHPCTREETSLYQNKIAEKLKQKFGMFSSESSSDHLASNLDNALYVAFPPHNGLKSKLVHRFIPFWQIVYHGIIISNPFYATIDYNYEKTKKHELDIANAVGGKEERRLYLYEFGGRPTFYNEFNVNNLAPVKQAYDEYQKLKHLQYEFIEGHKKIASDVYQTRFSDGSKIIANHSDADYVFEGEIVKAKDYKFLASPKEK